MQLVRSRPCSGVTSPQSSPISLPHEGLALRNEGETLQTLIATAPDLGATAQSTPQLADTGLQPCEAPLGCSDSDRKQGSIYWTEHVVSQSTGNDIWKCGEEIQLGGGCPG